MENYNILKDWNSSLTLVGMEDMLKELKGVEMNELLFNCIDFAQKLINVMLCFGGNAMCTELKGISKVCSLSCS